MYSSQVKFHNHSGSYCQMVQQFGLRVSVQSNDTSGTYTVKGPKPGSGVTKGTCDADLALIYVASEVW